jgi:hypothetical protein
MVGFCESDDELSGSIKKASSLTCCVAISFSKNILNYGVSN